MNTQVSTVNVIHFFDHALKHLHAFPDTMEGIQEAEACFKDLVKKDSPERERTPEEMAAFLDDGYYGDNFGTLILLVHSDRYVQPGNRS
jgi:hypothetical protein